MLHPTDEIQFGWQKFLKKKPLGNRPPRQTGDAGFESLFRIIISVSKHERKSGPQSLACFNMLFLFYITVH